MNVLTFSTYQLPACNINYVCLSILIWEKTYNVSIGYRKQHIMNTGWLVAQRLPFWTIYIIFFWYISPISTEERSAHLMIKHSLCLSIVNYISIFLVENPLNFFNTRLIWLQTIFFDKWRIHHFFYYQNFYNILKFISVPFSA